MEFAPGRWAAQRLTVSLWFARECGSEEEENALSHLLCVCVPPSRPYVCVFVITPTHMMRRFRGVFVANLILCGNIIYGDAITLCEIKVCHGKKKPCSQISNTESKFGDRCEYVEEEEDV